MATEIEYKEEQDDEMEALESIFESNFESIFLELFFLPLKPCVFLFLRSRNDSSIF